MSHHYQFYVSPEKVGKGVFFLAGDEFHHAVKVLRKKVGDSLAAADGLGNCYEGRIEDISSLQLKVRIDSKTRNTGEPELFLTLAQAVPKGSRFDWVIEKGTEIGVSVFQPLLTKYSLIDPSSRIERWRHKALSAMKQCGRSRCPEILPPAAFIRILKEASNIPAFIAHESYQDDFDVDFAALLKSSARAIVFVGPEGGFNQEEIDLAVENGVQPISLGSRRLCSETAGIVAAVKILSASGDLGKL
ncbi:MAG: 16S rRNA (uracil(1498)-N(3))-methyltransferase [Calditrichaeota bacterium]|nr:16S rRNA (uracil(1498)-N(3))-methyltransferase [Calditrichota bacterium]